MKYMKGVTLNKYVYVRNENNIATESGVEADVFSWLCIGDENCKFWNRIYHCRLSIKNTRINGKQLINALSKFDSVHNSCRKIWLRENEYIE